MENFDDILKTAEWNKEVSNIWENLEKNKLVMFPDNLEKANHYTNSLYNLMEHNQEKYRDNDGKKFYERVEKYIEDLNQKNTE
ncbi:MAG: hypothetical protein WC059_02900 [Candidatus Paceibacterota bacterium]